MIPVVCALNREVGKMAGGSTATVKHLATRWDPLDSSDWDKEKPTAICTTRIQR